MVEVAGEALEVVLHDESTKEVRVPNLHRDVPGQCDHAEDQDSRNGERAAKDSVVPPGECKDTDNYRGQERRYRAFGEHSQRPRTHSASHK